MFRKFYLLYGALVLSTAAFGQYRGWSLDTINQLKNVPKSVPSFRSAMWWLHWSSRLSEYSSSSSRSS